MLAVLGLDMPVTSVLPIHGVVQLGSNSARLILQRRYLIRPLLLWFSLGSLIGITLGASIVIAIPDWLAKWALALFILWSVYRKKAESSTKPHRHHYFVLSGAISGFCTMLVGATGPLVAALLANTGLTKQPLVATHAGCMVIQHGIKIGAFGMLGFAYAQWGPLIAAMIASGGLGTWVGTRILNHLPEASFRRGFKIMMTLMSAHMIWQAVVSAFFPT